MNARITSGWSQVLLLGFDFFYSKLFSRSLSCFADPPPTRHDFRDPCADGVVRWSTGEIARKAERPGTGLTGTEWICECGLSFAVRWIWHDDDVADSDADDDDHNTLHTLI